MKNTVLEAEIAKRKLPSLFADLQNERREAWEEKTRPYWKNLILEKEYGTIPPLVIPEVAVKENSVDFAGKALWEEVSFSFEFNKKKHGIPTQLLLPSKTKANAIIVYLNFRPDIPDRYLPVEELIDNGFGIFTVCYEDVTSDDGDFSNGLAGLFSAEERRGCDSVKIMYWSYMASRMMDYLLSRSELKDIPIGVCGHSRLGKAALLTAALDERFKFACSNNSGCSGASLSRGRSDKAETVRFILERFPYWFCPNYSEYSDNEESLPFDQHTLISLIAPRYVCVGAAVEDVWADNDNQFLSCYAASPAWELYGKKGLCSPDRLPILGDRHIDGNVGFFLRSGKHFHSREDWLVYMEFLKKHYKNDKDD